MPVVTFFLCFFRRCLNLFLQNSLMIFNNTRVIHARLLFRKDTGAQVEVFCLSPAEPSDYALNFQQRGKCSWHCMIGNAKRWKEGVLQLKIAHEKGVITLSAEKKEVRENDVTVEFSWNDSSVTFSELLEKAGKLPIPPLFKSTGRKQVTMRPIKRCIPVSKVRWPLLRPDSILPMR